jgi:DNA-binding NarL/FixJ family response regulator
MSSYRIVLADDHAMFRALLKKVLKERTDLEIVGEASDGFELLGMLSQISPHLVMLDISMPNLRGIDAIHEIKTNHPDIRVLILTMHKDMDFLHQAFRAGANGYLLKEDEETEIFSAIETIRAGRTYISPLLSKSVTDDWVHDQQEDRSSPPFHEPLTTRERQVLKLIAEGKSTKEIAGLLFISVHTVERHRAHIMDKLELKNTAELVKYAIQKGYV